MRGHLESTEPWDTLGKEGEVVQQLFTSPAKTFFQRKDGFLRRLHLELKASSLPNGIQS